MKKVYFGHPISLYGTVSEELLFYKINKEFSGCHIENPNTSDHHRGYQKYKLEKGNGMLYFFEEVLPLMDIGVFLAFQDGMFGAGVYREAEFLEDSGKPIFEIDSKGEISDLILDASKFLSVEETRARVYKKD